MLKRDKEKQRLAAAHALLNSSRPLNLAANPLLDEQQVRAFAKTRYPDNVLGDEFALGDLVRDAAQPVLKSLGSDPRVARERTVLEMVLAGGIVASAARQLGISREHLSSGAWKTSSGWLLDEFMEWQV